MDFDNFVPTVLSNTDTVQFIDGTIGAKLGDYAPVTVVSQMAYAWAE
jgi:hypothetical protein